VKRHRSPNDSLLVEYGECLSIYRGHGTLTLEGGEKFDCQFEAGQLTSAQVLLVCDFLPPSIFFMDILPRRFEGVTPEGYRIYASSGMFHRSSGNWAAFYLDEILVQMAEYQQTNHLRFGITNFEFIGTEPTRRSDNYFYHTLPLNLQNNSQTTKVLIEPLELYEKIMKRVKLLKNIEVTCEAIVDTIPDGDIGQAREVINDLCYILSVAQGTKVQWVYCDQYSVEGKLIKRTHSSRITKPYCPLKIIHPSAGGGKETKGFIEQVYATYVNKRERYKLGKGTIDAYLDAKAEADYLEMRGIKLVVAMEILKSVFIEQPHAPMKGYVIEEEKFKELSPRFCEAMDEFLQTEKIHRDYRKAMCNDKKVLELNRRSFAYFLKKLCRHIDLGINEDDVRLFIQCRNKLVHYGRFYCALATPEERSECNPLPSESHEYHFLVNFLDRVFLKLLGYSGPYVDYQTSGNPVHRDQV
jgi:hypothetical protein